MKKTEIESAIDGLVGNSHRYETGKEAISLIYPCRVSFDKYEIYCISGELFDDIERYDTFDEAEARINELLKET